jgi:hypothetical protein
MSVDQHWRVIGSADALGRKLVCKCTGCGSIRTIAAEALKTDPPRCDCRPLSRVEIEARRQTGPRLHDWRPKR